MTELNGVCVYVKIIYNQIYTDHLPYAGHCSQVKYNVIHDLKYFTALYEKQMNKSKFVVMAVWEPMWRKGQRDHNM